MDVSIDTEEYAVAYAVGIVMSGGADRLACCLAGMPHKPAATLIAIESLGERTRYLKRTLDTRGFRVACRRADNGGQSAYENDLDLPGAVKA